MHDGVQLKISYYSDSYIIKSSDNYFLVLNVFYRGDQMVYFNEDYYFQGSMGRGLTFPREDPTFSGSDCMCGREGSCPLANYNGNLY